MNTVSSTTIATGWCTGRPEFILKAWRCWRVQKLNKVIAK